MRCASASRWLLVFVVASTTNGFSQPVIIPSRGGLSRRWALSDDYLENDLVSVRIPDQEHPRLCVVRPYGTVEPLCQHEDDVELELFIDPRQSLTFWEELTDDAVVGTYGEGWYGQRPVPSLGGGPGYGAEANEIWSITEDVLEQIKTDGVELPLLDVGMAHGEKARGGAY